MAVIATISTDVTNLMLCVIGCPLCRFWLHSLHSTFLTWFSLEDRTATRINKTSFSSPENESMSIGSLDAQWITKSLLFTLCSLSLPYKLNVTTKDFFTGACTSGKWVKMIIKCMGHVYLRCTHAPAHQKTKAESSWAACTLSSSQVAQIREEILVIKINTYKNLQFPYARAWFMAYV